MTPTELADRGFRLIVSPLSLLLSAARSMNDAASRLSATGTMRDSLDQLMAFDDFNATVGLPEHLKAQAEFGG